MTATTVEDCFQFHKVDEFFAAGFDDWHRVTEVTGASFDPAARVLSLSVTTTEPDTGPSTMLIQVPRHDILRVRYNPDRATAADYPAGSPHSSANPVSAAAGAASPDARPEGVEAQVHADHVDLTTYHESAPHLRVCVDFQPMTIRVWRVMPDGAEYPVSADSDPAVLYRRNTSCGQGFGASVLAVKHKQPSAMHTGFGEHGSGHLFKERVQHTFFNFDNYEYNKVYGKGAGEEKEPLYHSSPFFLQLNIVPGQCLATGIFVDNTSQTLMDVGVTRDDQVRFVSLFGELDYYLFVGDTPADVINGYGLLIDHARLKPRWTLGYHQGCYGYETRADVETVARKYRDYGIPIDGLHIDVDIQRDYQTFTIDERTFPDPAGMFAGLRAAGIKCSTNITPILSDKNPDYSVYAEARDQGFLIADRRAAPVGRDAEVYEDYGGGHRIDHPERDVSPSNYDTGQPYIGEVYYGGGRGTTGGYPDLARPEVRQWWGRQYQPLFDAGLEMVWQDMTTPSVRNIRGDMCGLPFKLLVSDDSEGVAADGGPPAVNPAIAAWNQFSLNLHKATYEGLNALNGRENLRNLIIGRGGFSGMSRYAALWTGDNKSNWTNFQVSLPQMLAIGISAQPVAGPDVGGFSPYAEGHKWCDPALLIRWTAAGAFFPWFRNHYIRKDQKWFQEPWAYEELDLAAHGLEQQAWLYKSVLPICRYYTELRYRLMQVFYDGMWNNMLSGAPICRPLFLVHPYDTSLLYDKQPFQSTEFMVGDDLLVAPVLEPENECHGKRDVYLPAGAEWFAFTDARQPLAAAQPGGEVIGFEAQIDAAPQHLPYIVPLFVRAGAVVPMSEAEEFVGQRRRDGHPMPLTYTIYPGAQGSHTCYLDDGVSRSSAPEPDDAFDDDPAGRGEYRQVTVSHRFGRDQRTIDIVRDHDGYDPPEPFFYVALPHAPDECRDGGEPLREVTLGGTPLPKITEGTVGQRDAALRSSGDDAWYHNEAIRTTYVKVFDTSAALRLTAAYTI